MDGQENGGAPAALERAPSAQLLPPRDHQQPHYVLRSEHPAVELSWSTQMFSDRPKPDTLKLRKRVTAWPLEFTFKADYHTASREFSYGMMCRDAVIKGDITINMPQQQLEYRKRMALGGTAVLALNASCRLQDKKLHPDFGVSFEFGTPANPRSTGSAVFVGGPGGGSFDVQQRFTVVKGMALEVCGNVRLPSPAARYSADSGQLMLGEGALHVHVAEVNAVVHV